MKKNSEIPVYKINQIILHPIPHKRNILTPLHSYIFKLSRVFVIPALVH